MPSRRSIVHAALAFVMLLPLCLLCRPGFIPAASAPIAGAKVPASPVPEAKTATGQASLSAAVVDAMSPFLDSLALRRSLEEIALLKAAGFTYQAGLSVPQEICPQPGDQDQAAVLSGMVAADRAFALFFGRPEDAARENRLLRKISPESSLPTLSVKELKILQKDPAGPAGREIIAQRVEAEVKIMLTAARQSEATLRLVGAHLYGIFLERLYTTSIMVLAAAESGTLEPLYKVNAGLMERQGKILDLLARHDCIGAARFAASRRKVTESLLRLLGSNEGRPSLAQVERILDITREERADFMTPCP